MAMLLSPSHAHSSIPPPAGLMVGKALYEGILINVALAPFFVARLQGRSPAFDDLAALDPGLHRSLLQVKRYEGDLEDLGLCFATEDDFFGSTTQHELLPGGVDMPVTADNRLLYCHLLADWHLNVRLGRAAEAFARGLSHLVPPGAFRSNGGALRAGKECHITLSD